MTSTQPTTANPQTPNEQRPNITYKTGYGAVRKARRFALQGLYEWLLTDYRFEQQGKRIYIGGNAPLEIETRTRATNAMHTVHLGYYHELMKNIPNQVGELSILIGEKLVDRTLPRLDPIELAVLLIGAYELKYSLHIPYKVVIDEAIELNNHFGATDGYKLINAVMDKLAKQWRASEVAEHKANKQAKQNNAHTKKPTSDTPPNLD